MNTIPHIFQQIDGPAGPLLNAADNLIPTASILTVIASVNAPCSGVLVCSTVGYPVALYDGTTFKAIIPAGWNDYIGVRFDTTHSIGIQSMTGSDITVGTLALQLVQV